MAEYAWEVLFLLVCPVYGHGAMWYVITLGAKVGPPPLSLGCKAKGILSPFWAHIGIISRVCTSNGSFWGANLFCSVCFGSSQCALHLANCHVAMITLQFR